MALVKCTKEIKTHVQKQIDELFRDRINKAYELKGKTTQEIAEEVYSRIFTPERITTLRAVEKEIVGNVKLLYDNKDFAFVAKLPDDVNRKIEASWSKERPALAQFSSAYHTPEISGLTTESAQAIIEASQRRKAVVADRDQFKAGFTQAFDQVKSVNELIKLWPAVVELLPAGTMDRVNRKNGPRTKTEEVFDAAALNVQLLKAKVAK